MKSQIKISILSLLFLSCDNPEEPDTTPPTVSISSHSSGQTVNEIILIEDFLWSELLKEIWPESSVPLKIVNSRK